jgi:hypothetical protein
MKREKEAPIPFFLNPDVGKLEQALQMPTGFLGRLVEEDDWSFVVKSHALMESALSYLLRNNADQRAAAIFDTLPLRGRASKLAFIKRLCPLDEAVVQFINSYSDLRNTLLHDVKNVGFSFTLHFKNIPARELRKVLASYTDLLRVPEDVIARPQRERILEDNPREILLLSVMTVVSAAYFGVHDEEIETAWASLDRPVGALILVMILALASKRTA